MALALIIPLAGRASSLHAQSPYPSAPPGLYPSSGSAPSSPGAGYIGPCFSRIFFVCPFVFHRKPKTPLVDRDISRAMAKLLCIGLAFG